MPLTSSSRGARLPAVRCEVVSATEADRDSAIGRPLETHEHLEHLCARRAMTGNGAAATHAAADHPSVSCRNRANARSAPCVCPSPLEVRPHDKRRPRRPTDVWPPRTDHLADSGREERVLSHDEPGNEVAVIHSEAIGALLNRGRKFVSALHQHCSLPAVELVPGIGQGARSRERRT